MALIFKYVWFIEYWWDCFVGEALELDVVAQDQAPAHEVAENSAETELETSSG